MNNFATRLWRTSVGVLFPPGCLACEAPLPRAGQLNYCEACRQELPLFKGATCQRCGAPKAAPGVMSHRCIHCIRRAFRFDMAIAAGAYEGLLRRQVLAAKQVSGEGVAAALGRLTAAAAQKRLPSEQVDVVACIPMHWRRRLVRQHNLAESMGEILAGELGAPFAPRLLRTSRATKKQSQLPATQRRTNVRGVMAVRRGYRLHNATVLLVDDILTTGATCSDAARALKQAGAARVVAVVAARSL